MLLVLFIIVIFTLLGLAVVSASIGGAVRTETKQKDVQSLHLAEKALNEAVAMVQGMLKKETSINIEQLPTKLNALNEAINHHEVSSQYANTVVTDAELVKEEPPIIEVHVTATIDGVKRTLTQRLEVSNFPDVLRYSAGSEKGSLIINGNPYFNNGESDDPEVGGLYAGEEIRIKNSAEYMYDNNSDLREPTWFPELTGTAYVHSINNIKYCQAKANVPESCASATDFNTVREADGNTQNEPVQTVLGLQSIAEVKSEKEFVGMNMQESFIDKLTEAIGGTEADRNEMDASFKVSPSQAVQTVITKLSDGLVSPDTINGDDSTEVIQAKNNAWSSYKQALNGPIGNMTIVHRGNLTLDHGDYMGINYLPPVLGLTGEEENKQPGKQFREAIPGNPGFYHSNWLIVDGDLDIYNPLNAAPLDIRANILVTGDVNISGQVRMDATILALGQTTIQDASIEGMERYQSNGVAEAEKSELVLFSQGSILITRVNTNTDGTFKDISDSAYQNVFKDSKPDPGGLTKLDAFFYTDATAELYGVGSIFWINGGFFSKYDLKINAVRGDVQVNSTGTEIELNNENQKDLAYNRARFIITYNSSILEHQSAALPRVTSYQLKKGKKIMSNEQTPVSP